MDISLPVTVGSVAVSVGGFLAIKAWGFGANLVKEFRNHVLDDDKRMTAHEMSMSEVKGECRLITQKLESLKEAMKDDRDRTDEKLDILISRHP
jgi:hypothetical protein